MMYTGQSRITEGIKYLLIANAAIYLLQIFPFLDYYLTGFGALQPSLVLKGHVWRLVSYMFLHGNHWHILFNMLALWMFGLELEMKWGTRRFLEFYFITGVGSGILSLLTIFGGNNPIIGASGAVYGILVAYAWYFPDRQVLMFFVFPVPVRVAVIIFGAISILGIKSGTSNIAHLTHLGGIVVAILYLKFYNNVESFISHRKALSAERKMRSNAEKVMNDKMFYENVIDPILKKISDSGLDSLTANEKDTLERFSKKKGNKKE